MFCFRRRFLSALLVLLTCVMAATAQGASNTTIGLWTDRADFESNARTLGTQTTRLNIDTASDPGNVRIGAPTDFATTATITCLTPNRVYTTGTDRNSVVVLDSLTRKPLITIPIEGKVAGVVYNPVQKKVYVGRSDGNTVTVLDNSTSPPSVLRTITTSGAQGNSAFAALYNTDRNKVYIADVAGRRVEIYDGATDVLLAVVPVVAGATTASYDADNQKVYFTNKANDFVTVIDGIDNTVESVQVAEVLNLLGGEVGLRTDVAGQGVSDADNIKLSWDYDCEGEKQSIEFQVRAATALSELGAAPYTGPNGSAENWYKTECSAATTALQTGSIDLPYAAAMEMQVRLTSNGLSSPVLREVRLEAQLYPNLTTGSVTVSPSTTMAGSTVTVTGTIHNAGRGAAEASFAGVGLTGAGYSGTLATVAVPALDPGQSHTFTATVTIPEGTAPGSYDVTVCADSANEVVETAEQDNCSSAALRITLPDFVTTVTAPATAGSGESIPVFFTVTNQGEVTAATAQHSLTLTNGVTSVLLTSTTTAPLAAGASHAGSFTWNSQGVLPGSYRLVFCADHAGQVSELSEENNCSESPIQISYPDLSLTDITGPAEATIGGQISVSTTVSNQQGPVGSSHVGIYLTRNGIDYLIGSREVPPLVAGGAHSASATVTVQATDLTTGAYRLKGCVDYQNQVTENNEDNNCFTGGEIFVYSAPADLVVTDFTFPASAGTGQQITIPITVKNQGTTTVSYNYVKLYYSADPTFATRTYLQYCNPQVGVLAKGAQQTVTCTVNMPAITAGTYYIQAVADDTNYVAEFNESNNTLVRGPVAVSYGPDLVVREMTLPSTAATGQSLTIPVIVKNQGIGYIRSTQIYFYYSTDPTFSEGKTLLTYGTYVVPALSAGAEHVGNVTVRIPYITAGTYYIQAVADNDNWVVESDEGNNTLIRGPLAVTYGPDLVVTQLAAPPTLSTGQQVTIPVTLKNQGIGTIESSIYYNLYLSTDPTFATGIALLPDSSRLSRLGIGAEQTISITASVPHVAAGTYYIKAVADDNNAILESDEGNNSLVSGPIVMSYGPDLVVTQVTPPSTAAIGVQTTIPVKVKNQGIGSSQTTYLELYYSTDPTFATGKTLLTNSNKSVIALAAGAEATINVTPTMPNVAPGTYYIQAFVDQGNVNVEADEGNNTLVSGPVDMRYGPDLVVSQLTVPPTGVSGQPITISVDVKNQGISLSESSDVWLQYSADPTFATWTYLSDTHRAVSSMYQGSHQPMTITTVLPSLPAGTYYIRGEVDFLHKVNEGDEGNNFTVGQPITITP